MWASAMRWLRTVRHLLPSQMAALALFELRRRIGPMVGPLFTSALDRLTPRSDGVNEPLLDAWAKMLPTHLPLPMLHHSAQTMMEGRPHFVGHTVVTDGPHPDWRPIGSPSRLWDYHLHYFDVLPGLAARIADGDIASHQHLSTMLTSWDQQNPLGSSPGWDPYPVSLRVVNLLRSAALIPTRTPVRDRLLTMALRHSVVLLTMVEWHLQANHLWANAKALVLAGAVFEESPGSRVLWAMGRLLMNRELKKQFLADGGHFERSPMYHSILVRDLRECVALLPQSRLPGAHQTVQNCRIRLNAAEFFDQTFQHPDGSFPHFNDTAQAGASVFTGILPRSPRRDAHLTGKPDRPASPNAPHRSKSRARGPTLITFPETGYSVAERGDWFLCFDHGAIGPDEQPGHGHADMLSLEVSFRGQRLLTNGGTGGYAHYPWRRYERSTSSHNTVQLAGQDQVELWGQFRVGRRTVPTLLQASSDAHHIELRASCTWTGLHPSSTHDRRISITDAEVQISDVVSPHNLHQAIVRYQFAPEWVVRRIGPGRFGVTCKDKELIFSHNANTATLGTTLHAPSFGQLSERACISLVIPDSGSCIVHIRTP